MIHDERLDKQIKFLIEADKIKNVFRRTYNVDLSRKENSAEHSWRLALLALVLSEYSNKEIDKLRVMSMVIIHDLIEIDAGDTYLYDAEANLSKAEREELIKKMTNEMKQAAKMLEFEYAAELRDKIAELKK